MLLFIFLTFAVIYPFFICSIIITFDQELLIRLEPNLVSLVSKKISAALSLHIVFGTGIIAHSLCLLGWPLAAVYSHHRYGWLPHVNMIVC